MFVKQVLQMMFVYRLMQSDAEVVAENEDYKQVHLMKLQAALV